MDFYDVIISPSMHKTIDIASYKASYSLTK